MGGKQRYKRNENINPFFGSIKLTFHNTNLLSFQFHLFKSKEKLGRFMSGEVPVYTSVL